ncbi:molybdopterin-dependent oxidoreductase [soil metagenome]
MAFLNKDPRLITYGETNLGMPLVLAEDLLVPNELFFVRSNGPTPTISCDEWTLTIDGAVDRTITLTYRQLLELPAHTATAFLECTGNSRSRFDPPAEGTPWQNDAVGNATWTGVQLDDVLKLASPKPSSVDVVSQGADLATMRRGIPVATARNAEVMLAFSMNNEPLPAAHGGPVRLLVPRWAGIASTKWLTRLEVWDRPFTGPFQGDLYVVYDQDGTPIAPISQMPVKSIIASPVDGQLFESPEVEIRGFAWSGHAGIAKVDVSIDSGEAWRPADIVETAGPLSWVKWSFRTVLPPGNNQVSTRATDARGLQQPRVAMWNQKGYMMNAIHTVSFSVSPSKREV